MSARAIVWIVVGVATGMTHASSLRRSTQEYGTRSWDAMLRLPMVAAVLVIATWRDELLLAAIGWFIGLLATGMFYVARTRRWK